MKEEERREKKREERGGSFPPNLITTNISKEKLRVSSQQSTKQEHTRATIPLCSAATTATPISALTPTYITNNVRRKRPSSRRRHVRSFRFLLLRLHRSPCHCMDIASWTVREEEVYHVCYWILGDAGCC